MRKRRKEHSRNTRCTDSWETKSECMGNIEENLPGNPWGNAGACAYRTYREDVGETHGNVPGNAQGTHAGSDVQTHKGTLSECMGKVGEPTVLGNDGRMHWVSGKRGKTHCRRKGNTRSRH